MKNFSTTHKFTLYGFLFGLCFPLMGMWILSINHDVGFWETQFISDSLLLIIDTAPLVLGFFAYLIGKRQQHLEEALTKIEEESKTVSEQGSVNKKVLAQTCLVLIILLSASWSLWSYLNKIKEINLEKNLSNLSHAQFNSSIRSFENLMLAMDRLAERTALPNKSYWERDSKSYLDHFQVFQAIEYADSKNIVQWVNPVKGNELALNLNLGFEDHRQQALSLAIQEGKGVFSDPVDLVQGGKGILSIHPVFKDNQHSGFIVGVYHLNLMFEKYLKPNFEYSILIDEETVYQSAQFSNKKASQSDQFKLRNLVFQANFHPGAKLIKENKHLFENTFILSILLLSSLILTFLFSSLQNKKYKLYHSRERNREALRENTRISTMIQSVFDNAQGVIYRCDPNDNWTMRYINNEIENLSGYPAKDFIEDKVRSYASIIHPEDVEIVDQTVFAQIEKNSSYELDYRIVHQSGDIKLVHERGAPLFDDKGKCIALDGFIVDITERKNLEKLLEQEKVKSIQNAKLATLGEMAAGIAHEINNPLSIISNSVELMIRKNQNLSLGDKNIKKIIKSIKRMSRIVKGLKKFSRKTDEIAPSENSLLELVQESLELTYMKSKQKNVPVLLDSFEDTTVVCDDIQTEQVMINLINNAIDASMEKEDAWVKISIENNEDNSVNVVVTDAGTGIDEKIIANLFDPFFTTKTKSLGTGLGLSISKNIANEQGGDLAYELRDGHTSFVFTLPKAS